jgi:hypothetical protein
MTTIKIPDVPDRHTLTITITPTSSTVKLQRDDQERPGWELVWYQNQITQYQLDQVMDQYRLERETEMAGYRRDEIQPACWRPYRWYPENTRGVCMYCGNSMNSGFMVVERLHSKLGIYNDAIEFDPLTPEPKRRDPHLHCCHSCMRHHANISDWERACMPDKPRLLPLIGLGLQF